MVLTPKPPVSLCRKKQHPTQDGHGRNEHHEDAAIQHAGPFGLLSLGRALAHHTLPRQAGGEDEGSGQQAEAPHRGRISIKRKESGIKINSSKMQKTSIGNKVRNKLKRSNFRCMK